MKIEKGSRLLRLAAAALASTALVATLGCASGKSGQPETEVKAAGLTFKPCTAAIRAANCAWTGSYPHVRQQHCEGSCTSNRKSQYRTGFIDTCNDARLAEVCSTTVQNAKCEYAVDSSGAYVVRSLLTVVVGTDANASCANSSYSTVVLDQAYKVVTMYPGS